MKKQFCKILLAVSFLFLVPAFCMSQNLKGIWKLVQSEGSSQVVRYKVLDKEGNYFNVDAYIKNAVDVSSGSRSSDDVFCPYKITRSGEYSIIAFTARNCVMNMADRQMLSFLYLTGLTERK